MSPVPTKTPYVTNTPSPLPSATLAVYPNSMVTGIVYRENDRYRMYVGRASQPIRLPDLSLEAGSEATEADLANIPVGSTLVVLQGTYFTGESPYLLVTDVALANLPYDENTPLTDTHIFSYPRFSFAIPEGWFVNIEHLADHRVVRITNWDTSVESRGPGFEYIDYTAYNVDIQRIADFSVADYIDQGVELWGPERFVAEIMMINGRSVTRVSVKDVGDDKASYFLELNGEIILLHGPTHNASFIERLLDTILVLD